MNIDPEWLAEQNKLYAWDVYFPDTKVWVRLNQYHTVAQIEKELPKSEGYRHVRGAEFLPPEEV